MSIQSQAILIGHVSAEHIARVIRDEFGYFSSVRSMQEENYKIVEFSKDPNYPIVIHAFLESYAAEDYAGVFQGASTLVTAEYSPSAFELISALACHFGGFCRRTDDKAWNEVGK